MTVHGIKEEGNVDVDDSDGYKDDSNLTITIPLNSISAVLINLTMIQVVHNMAQLFRQPCMIDFNAIYEWNVTNSKFTQCLSMAPSSGVELGCTLELNIWRQSAQITKVD